MSLRSGASSAELVPAETADEEAAQEPLSEEAKELLPECENDEECPVPENFYQLLNVARDASKDEIKTAYKQVFRKCHPDIAGDDANEVCILVGDAYKTLTDPTKRSQYDQEVAQQVYGQQNAFDQEGYTGKMVSKWGANDPERGLADQRGVFVDEGSCIGCRMCNNFAPGTFGMEEEWGRARVHTQWGDGMEEIDQAIESCPVECIHYVKKRYLPVLEWCMTKTKRVPVAVMLGGGASGQDPFMVAKDFIRRGEEKRGKMRAQLNAMDPEADANFALGMTDEQIQFGFAMRAAWSKLTKKTKQAWTFHLEPAAVGDK